MDENNLIHFVNESFLKLRDLQWDKTVGELCYNISNGAVRYIDDYAIPLYRDPQTGLTYLLEIMVNRSEEMQELEQCNKDLFVQCEEDQVRSDRIRMRRNVPSGICIFDLYQSQISDNTDSYDMYVLFDRTKEVSMRSKLQCSYMRIVNILQSLINNEWLDADMTSKEKLNDLQQQAETLASKYQL